VEIQALWIRLLRQIQTIGCESVGEDWSALAARAEESLRSLFWVEAKGWIADCLHAAAGTGARDATQDDALRSNCVLPIMFGLFEPFRSRRCLEAVRAHLIVPGALRTLAPLRVEHVLPIHGPDWRLLNNPSEPYWGHYEGDEDTQRKPAYHNGTAWTWTFPGFCEALARAWDFQPAAVEAAKAYLSSMAPLLEAGCLGHLPEILDGDAPHVARGCDAQAWGVTEALRVWKLLSEFRESPNRKSDGHS
jgi:glycogen debranching enzyme